MSGIEKLGKGGSPWPTAGERKVEGRFPSLGFCLFSTLGSVASRGLFLFCPPFSAFPKAVCLGGPSGGRLVEGRGWGGALLAAPRIWQGVGLGCWSRTDTGALPGASLGPAILSVVVSGPALRVEVGTGFESLRPGLRMETRSGSIPGGEFGVGTGSGLRPKSGFGVRGGLRELGDGEGGWGERSPPAAPASLPSGPPEDESVVTCGAGAAMPESSSSVIGSKGSIPSPLPPSRGGS